LWEAKKKKEKKVEELIFHAYPSLAHNRKEEGKSTWQRRQKVSIKVE
jgi:ABC-type branched-subunit amino acid transport system ATPase component